MAEFTSPSYNLEENKAIDGQVIYYGELLKKGRILHSCNKIINMLYESKRFQY